MTFQKNYEIAKKVDDEKKSRRKKNQKMLGIHPKIKKC
jgi:hypothetical protein